MVSRPEAQTLLILRPLHASGALHPTLAIVKRPLTNNNVVPGPQSRPTNDRRQGKAALRGAARRRCRWCMQRVRARDYKLSSDIYLRRPAWPSLASPSLSVKRSTRSLLVRCARGKLFWPIVVVCAHYIMIAVLYTILQLLGHKWAKCQKPARNGNKIFGK